MVRLLMEGSGCDSDEWSHRRNGIGSEEHLARSNVVQVQVQRVYPLDRVLLHPGDQLGVVLDLVAVLFPPGRDDVKGEERRELDQLLEVSRVESV
jgi:hypothetical protein